jgi:hypothetical protein
MRLITIVWISTFHPYRQVALRKSLISSIWGRMWAATIAMLYVVNKGIFFHPPTQV